MVTPDGGHSYYGNRVLNNGGALDVDVTTGYGPEIFSSPSPQNGTYLVYLNYYGGESDKVMTTATLTITKAMKAVPMRKTKLPRADARRRRADIGEIISLPWLGHDKG